jgi:hypothetical protein
LTKKIDKSVQLSVSPRPFKSRFFACFSAIGVQNSKKNPKPIFLDFFLSRFWAFLGEGSP